MKHLGKYCAAFFVVTALLSVAACSSAPTQEGTGEYLDDSVVTGKVKSTIFGDPKLKSMEINVETFKGVVQLSGFVSSQAASDHAEQLVKTVKGVKSVKNDMRVK
ncbi:BON domain-containing protein [Iodobacter fluviatilis]|jgi:osmotically-inducible protein OsmY|uniref:Osmotically-inducible protein Y n=1 Tax=Iodobacter fluviatilis TaxID=537 RepID=A0A7G3G7A7_9NEIS|nr:BON domain-containing protein [Iodobacter fluviatilis]QBC43197.1 transporter [Iodobacter fluviatilis]